MGPLRKGHGYDRVGLIPQSEATGVVLRKGMIDGVAGVTHEILPFMLGVCSKVNGCCHRFRTFCLVCSRNHSRKAFTGYSSHFKHLILLMTDEETPVPDSRQAWRLQGCTAF